MSSESQPQQAPSQQLPRFTHYPRGLTAYDALAHYRIADRSQPWVRAMMISSLDGAASLNEKSGGLGDPDDQLIFTTTRTVADAVLVGAGTVRVEGYNGVPLPPWAQEWRSAQGLSPQPRLVILSRSGAIPVQLLNQAAKRSKTEEPPLLITQREAGGSVPAGPLDVGGSTQSVGADPRGAGAVEKLEVDDITDLAGIVAELNARGYSQIVLEGGPTVLATAHHAGVIDELCLSLSPLMVGGPGPRIVNDRELNETVVRKYQAQEIVAGQSILFLRYWMIRDNIDE